MKLLIRSNLMVKSFLLVMVVSGLSRCVSSSKTDQSEKEEYKAQVEEMIGSPTIYVKNSSGDKVLCMNIQTETDKLKKDIIKALVWDLKVGKVIYQTQVNGGSVKWFDSNHLEIFRTPGMVQRDKDPNDYIQIVEVNSQNIMSKTNFLKSKDL